MSMVKPNYLDVIVRHFPALNVKCVGDADKYENLSVESGDTLPAKSVLDTHLVQMTRDVVWSAIQDERTRRQNGGVFISSVNKWFHSDQTSRLQQIGLVMMGNNMPTGIQWKTMDGSFIEMTPALALSVFNALATLDMTAFAVAEQHRANMNQMQNPIEYNFSTFWPAIYSGA